MTKLGHVADFGELELALEPVVSQSKALILPSDTGPSYTKQPVFSIGDDDVLSDDFVWQAMTKAYDPETNTVRDLRIDDSDLRAADNYYDFCSNLAGKNIKMPFARQLWIAIVALAEYCVAGDTYITTNRGLVRIDSLSTGTGLNPIRNLRVVTRDGNQRVSHLGQTKRKAKILRVTPKGEIPVECTPNHKFLVMQADLTFKWVEAKDLNIGDTLVSKVGANMWPATPVKLDTAYEYERHSNNAGNTPSCNFRPLPAVTEELARLTGYILTDGCIGKYGIGYTNTDKALMLDFLHCAHSVFNLSLKEINLAVKCIEGMTYPTIRLNTYTSDYLQHLGLKPGACYNKVLPDYILQSPANIAANCLQAMFDSDGWIDRHSSGEDTLRIGMALTSNKMLRQVHLLLKNFGIDGSFTEYKTKEFSAQAKRAKASGIEAKWVISDRKSKLLFAKYIGSKHSVKKEVLADFVSFCKENKPSIRRLGREGKIPSGFVRWIDYPNLSRLLHPRGKTLYNRTGRLSRSENFGFSHYHEYRVVPKDVALRIFNPDDKQARFFKRDKERKVLLDRLLELKRLNYSFSPVVSIDDAGTCDVYDLTVPSNESFQANGTIVHNCPKCTPVFWSGCIENVPVDMDPHDLAKKFVLLKRGTCPKCGSKRGALILAGELNDYYEIVLVFGQRAGKSIFTATLVCYLIHCYLKLPKLSTIAKGIQDFTPLTGTFVAITATKAIKLLWDPIRNMIANSEWFSDYFSVLEHYGKVYSKEFYQFSPTGTYLRFFNKNLDFYPEGPGKRTLRGPTRAMGGIDELGHFPFKAVDPNALDDDGGDDDERERANAEEVHTVLSRSLATLRTEMPGFYKQGIHHVPQAMLINISSPSSWKDKIMRLLKESETNSSMLGLNYPTWEINPLYTRDHPVIRDAYKRNPRTAERDFGANPPKLASTIFDKANIVGLFSGENTHAISYEESAEKTLAKVITKIEHNRLPATVLTLDAGATNNSYSGTLQYKDGADVKVLSLIEIIPKKGKRIDFYHVYQHVLKPIIATCNVKLVVYDRWNSYQVIDQISADFNGKVKASQYTLKPRDFRGFQDIVNNQHLLLPKLELEPDRIEVVTDYRKELDKYPASHLYLQFLTVQELGGVWVKGDGYTDDILRALILGVTTLFNPKVAEYMSKFKVVEREGVSAKATVLIAGRSSVFNNFSP